MDSTLAKGLAVLDWLVRQQRPCRVSDVAQAHGLARINAHRTLQTLVSCGWALQDPHTRNYQPSLRLFELGTLVEAAADVARLARPHLAALAQATGETIHLAVLDGPEIVYVDTFDSPLPVAAYSRIGGRALSPSFSTPSRWHRQTPNPADVSRTGIRPRRRAACWSPSARSPRH